MKQTEDTIIVIFGASGDLTWRKLIPALYDLYFQNLLPDHFKILGVGRKALSDADFAKKMGEGLVRFVSKEFNKSETIESFCGNLLYQSMDTADKNEYLQLKDRLRGLAAKPDSRQNYLFYFATPPSLYAVIAENLHFANLTEQDSGWKRVIVEKPFGRDIFTAKELNHNLLRAFTEDQIYRIDHYLGKETVQNIMVTRFSNSIFEPLWNRNYIERIEITAAEALGVESRAGYYETAGALRDMLQNHLMQIMAIVAMEPPVSSNSSAIRHEMLKVFQSLRPIKQNDVPNKVVRGQYTASQIKGKTTKAYREEAGVAPESKTETFVALKCNIDNWRWNGVPFYLRTGKSMPTRVTEVAIHFKPNPHKIFADCTEISCPNNQLIIRIQPNEGMLIKFGMKVPGAGFTVDQVNMDFHYSSLKHEHIPEAYERLIYDCLIGDSTLFQHGEALETTWQYVQPILDAWQNSDDIPMYGYPAGTWGPETADQLLLKDGFYWRYPCKNLLDDGVYCEL